MKEEAVNKVGRTGGGQPLPLYTGENALIQCKKCSISEAHSHCWQKSPAIFRAPLLLPVAKYLFTSFFVLYVLGFTKTTIGVFLVLFESVFAPSFSFLLFLPLCKAWTREKALYGSDLLLLLLWTDDNSPCFGQMTIMSVETFLCFKPALSSVLSIPLSICPLALDWWQSCQL